MKARLGVLLLLLTLLSGALLTTNLSTASAAGFTARLTQTPSIIGERIQVRGVIAPRGRPIQLQRYRSGRWVRVLSSQTVGGGRYVLPVRATAVRIRYRAFAPAVRISGHRYAAVGSNVVAVAGVRATAALAFAPAAVGQNQAGTQNLTPGTVTFTPARPGAPVTVQRLSGSTWTTVLTGTQSSVGALTFTTPGGSAAAPRTFRAFTRAPGVTVSSPAARPAYWPLRWHDEFSAGSVDPNKWTSRQVGLTFGKRSCAAVEPSQATISSVASGDYLRLSVARDTTGAVHPPAGTTCPRTYLNGMVGTNPGEFSSPGHGQKFTYGMFAARVKFQTYPGQHGGFWLQGVDPCGPEVDVAEYFGAGHADGGLNSYLHLPTPGPTGGCTSSRFTTQGGAQPTSKAILGTGHNPANGWHVYSVQWTATQYVVRIDGVVTFHTTQGVSSTPAFLVLSLLTSDWELPLLDPAKLPSAMYVDWVRVWQS